MDRRSVKWTKKMAWLKRSETPDREDPRLHQRDDADVGIARVETAPEFTKSRSSFRRPPF